MLRWECDWNAVTVWCASVRDISAQWAWPATQNPHCCTQLSEFYNMDFLPPQPLMTIRAPWLVSLVSASAPSFALTISILSRQTWSGSSVYPLLSVHLGYSDKITQTGWLINNRNLLPPVWRLGSLRSKHQHDSARSFSWFINSWLSFCWILTWWKRWGSSLGSFLLEH